MSTNWKFAFAVVWLLLATGLVVSGIQFNLLYVRVSRLEEQLELAQWQTYKFANGEFDFDGISAVDEGSEFPSGRSALADKPTQAEICKAGELSRLDNRPWGGIVKVQNLLACKEVSAELLSQALALEAVRANWHEFASEAGPFHIRFNGKIIKSEGSEPYYFIGRIDGIEAFALGDCSDRGEYPKLDSDLEGRIAVIYPCPAGD